MSLNINGSSLNIFQSHTNHYNNNLKASQDKDEIDKVSSKMVSQKLRVDEEVSLKEDGVVTQISEQGDQVTLSKEGLSRAKVGAPTGGDSSPSGTPSAGATSSTDSSSQDLSTYSDSQLKTMMSKGEISQSQYIQEKAKRLSEESEMTDTTIQLFENENSTDLQYSSINEDDNYI